MSLRDFLNLVMIIFHGKEELKNGCSNMKNFLSKILLVIQSHFKTIIDKNFMVTITLKNTY